MFGLAGYRTLTESLYSLHGSTQPCLSRAGAQPHFGSRSARGVVQLELHSHRAQCRTHHGYSIYYHCMTTRLTSHGGLGTKEGERRTMHPASRGGAVPQWGYPVHVGAARSQSTARSIAHAPWCVRCGHIHTRSQAHRELTASSV